MKKLKQNIIKGVVTSLIGVATMIITLALLWKGSIDFIWEGVGGLTMGAILLLAPKTIEKKVAQAIDRFGGNVNVQVSSPEQNVSPNQIKDDNTE